MDPLLELQLLLQLLEPSMWRIRFRTGSEPVSPNSNTLLWTAYTWFVVHVHLLSRGDLLTVLGENDIPRACTHRKLKPSFASTIIGRSFLLMSCQITELMYARHGWYTMELTGGLHTTKSWLGRR